MPKVSVILVSFNSAAHLGRCIEGLANQTFQDFDVVVVDNGSSDSSVDLVRTAFTTATICRNADNLGFAAGCNQGLRASTSEHALLLNTDCFLEAGYIETLVRHLDQRPRLAGVQGKYLLDANPAIVDSLGIRLRITGVASDIRRGRRDDGRTEPFEVDGVCAAAALLRRSALSDIEEHGNYFDPDFRNYYEDVDLCWRLRRKGWAFECHPLAVARHVRGGSQRDPASMNRLALRNKYFALAKNLPLIEIPFRLPFILGWEGLKLFRHLFQEPRVLRGYVDVCRDVSLFLRKRNA